MFYAQSTIMVISGWRLKQKLISDNFWATVRGQDSRNGIWNAPIGLVILNWYIIVFIRRWKITKPKTKFANVGLWYWLSLSSWEMMETSSHAVMTKKQKTILIKSARAVHLWNASHQSEYGLGELKRVLYILYATKTAPQLIVPKIIVKDY